MDVLVLLNPVSSRFEPGEVRRILGAWMEQHGIDHRIADLPEQDTAGFAEQEIARALDQGCTRVVAAGGDGTIGLVAAALDRAGGTERGASLGIVPAGTANVLARELGLPGDLEGAAAVVTGGRALDLDAIRIGDRLVLTQVGIGPDALMIHDASRGEQKDRSRFAYVTHYARRALRHRPGRFRIEVDGTRLRARAWQIVVANVGTLAQPPFTWGPRIDPTDGVLELCIYDVRRVREAIALAVNIVTGRHRHDPRQRFLRIREKATIEGDRPLLVQGDGEILGRTPIELSVVPRAIRVIVPAPEPAAEDAGRGAEDAASPAGPPEPAALRTDESIGADVESMMAQRSPTWVLQGPLRHPITAAAALDAAVFLRVNALPLGGLLDHALSVISRLMHYGEGWIVVAAIAIAADPRAGLRLLAEAVPVLWLTMLTVNFPIKSLFRRRRPFVAFVKARVVGPRPRDFSFPSGHTAAGFAGALLFSSHFPAAAPVFYAVAAIVGFSRIYLGVHYPSDVLIGAAIGTALAAGYRALVLWLVAAFLK